MVFRSKIDGFFKGFIVVWTLIFGGATISPIFFANLEAVTIIVLMNTFIACEGFILWLLFYLKYVLHSEYLYVRGGPFSAKIRYEMITQIKKTHQIIAGYRLLSSRKAVKISYKNAFWGSIIISPHNRDVFIKELKKRCQHI